MVISEIEKGAFALFSRDGLSHDYKRLICYLVYKVVSSQTKAMQLERLVHEISQKHAIQKEDIRGAISALRSPLAFGALCIYSASDKNRLCKVSTSPTIDLWVKEMENNFPHICQRLQ